MSSPTRPGAVAPLFAEGGAEEPDAAALEALQAAMAAAEPEGHANLQ